MVILGLVPRIFHPVIKLGVKILGTRPRMTTYLMIQPIDRFHDLNGFTIERQCMLCRAQTV